MHSQAVDSSMSETKSPRQLWSHGESAAHVEKPWLFPT